MAAMHELPLPVLDALPLGAHRIMAFTDEALFEACGVRIAFTGREGGVSTGSYASLNCGPFSDDDEQAVACNRQRVLELAGAGDAALVKHKQVHGTQFIDVVERADVHDTCGDTVHDVDGLLVGLPNVAVIMPSADCPIVFVVSPSGRFVGAHAGWRGAVKGIAGMAAERLARFESCDPARFNAYIGPHICEKCFEVQGDVSQRIVAEFGDCCIPDERHVNLSRAIIADLVRCGLEPRRIVDAGECTACHPERNFSYRASGGICGRQAGIAVRMDVSNHERAGSTPSR